MKPSVIARPSRTSKRYKISLPHARLAVIAATTAAISLGALVVLPAHLEAADSDSPIAASLHARAAIDFPTE
jgi:hypothetical protein